MGTKLFLLFFLYCANVSFGGEKRITGNFQWDLVQVHQDTVSSSVSVLVQSPQKQEPFLNGLYSLALPGVGQFQTEHYTKAAIFISAEVALVVYALVNNSLGNTKTTEFQAYAEQHWSPERYAKWINTYGVSEYGPAASIDLNRVRQYDFSEINDWERGVHKLGFSHSLPKFREQQYYELIGKYHQFKYGWDKYPDLNLDGIPDSDGGRYDDFIPQQLKDYAVERGKANDYYYAASFAVSVLVINHVLSAIDAIISTKSYNSTLSASLNMKPVDGVEGKRLLSQLTIKIGLQ
ncbi:MAG: hypothetical protein WDA22_04105 [Bacteroidota bacterium]